MDSEITVIIPSYNSGRFLIDALQSVYEQTYSNWKLILVDDCSNDDSLKLAEKLLDDPRITVIKNDVNLGQSKAQNVALKYITTPYFIQLDSDDWFVPDTLETVVNEFKKQQEDVGIVSGNIKIVIESTEQLNKNGGKPTVIMRRGRLYKDKYELVLFSASVWPRCYRTSAVKKIGGWPTGDKYGGRYMEDKLILYRLAEEYKFHWINKVLYVHRRHDNNSTNNIGGYNDVYVWYVEKMLKRWGNEYVATFSTDCGWKIVKCLVRNSDGQILTRDSI